MGRTTRPRSTEDGTTHEILLPDAGLCCLVFIGEHSRSVQLPSMGTIVLGRGSDVDVSLMSDGVSRKHARLEVARHIGTLHDLGSRNGTFVNGERIRGPKQVGHGDEIRIGDAQVVLYRRSGAVVGQPVVLLHGAFSARLRLEVERAIGFGRPISLVALQLVDRWYELLALRPLLSRLRPVDICGAYNDRIIEIALPEMSEVEAQRVLSGLRDALQQAGVESSAGCATLAARAGSAEELLERALAALQRQRGQAAPARAEEHEPVICDPVMLHIYEQVRRAAKSNLSVLIVGETGVGKEVIARAVHRHSGRSGPLICVNTAAIAESLLDSELFGHERGAFTGATEAKEGLFEAAHRGTLFLDEVGEVPLAMQAKLLRVLEEHTVRRVGSTREREIDVRVVAATNCDLEQRARQGAFRPDLLFRLNACAFVIPPLRDRPSDIPHLAQHFLARACALSRAELTISASAMNVLVQHSWPGNVRELRNVIDRAAAFCDGDRGAIEPEHLPDTLRLSVRPEVAGDTAQLVTDGVRDTMRAFERRQIVDALEQAGGNRSRAAAILGMPRKTLAYRMERLGISLPKR